MEGGSHLKALSELLNPPEQDDSEEELAVHPSPYATPGSIGPTTGKEILPVGKDPSSGASKVIWDEEEVSRCQHYEYSDVRSEPDCLGGKDLSKPLVLYDHPKVVLAASEVIRYDIVFKQVVSTEDVFLGLGRKNPTTACCQELVVKVTLPNTDYKDVELDVTETFFDCRTPEHRLGLYLPQPVDSSRSKAKWLSDLEVLEVTLKLKREYDFLNIAD